MIIKPIPHGLEHIVGVSPAGRTHGKLHMSDLYGLYHESTDKKKRSNDDGFAEAGPLYFEAGLSWESILEKGLKDRICSFRPGELVTPEGIVYSPDLFLFPEDVPFRNCEIKLTWMSSKDVPREEANSFPLKFEKYFTQMMAYGYHLETPYARLICFFVNGNYRPPRPELLAWDIEFTKRELDENWRKLLNMAKAEGLL